MLPIVDKPLIQYAAEEALQAGAEKLVFITGYAKRAIEDHFDSDHELEKELEAQGKHDLLDAVRASCPRMRAASTSASRRRSGSATPCSARAPRSATNHSSSTSPTT